VARCWAGFASFGAGLVHVAVVRDHLEVSVSHGVFFAVVGLAQIGWGLWSLSGTAVPRPLSTVSATVVLIALWAVSRTVGLPFGLGGKEPIGTADVLAVVLEVGLILCVALAARSRATVRRGVPQQATPALASARFVALLAAGALAVSALATPAMAATMAGDHAHPHGHSPSQEQDPADHHAPGSEPSDGHGHGH
jgi:hypothetical protein